MKSRNRKAAELAALVIIFLCLIPTLAISASSEQPRRGTITATVLDSNGKPVFEAIVQMLPTDRGAQRAPVRECLTNEHGLCALDLNFDQYHITAMKTSDGYPDLSFNFYGHGKWLSTVSITPEKPAIPVTIKLGPKAASLILHVIDAATGVRIKQSAVTLRPSADPHDFLSSNLDRDSTVLIPPDEDVSVQVSADGYKTLQVHFTSAQESVRLHSGESKELKIPLEALPNGAP